MQDERPEIANLSPQEKRQLLARLIRERRGRSDSAFSLSYGQQALWYLQQVTPDSAAYNFMYAWWIRSDVDFEALRRAFQGLLDRHAVLRTTYGTQDGRPVQMVQSRAEVYFKEIDARAWTFEQLEQQLHNEAHRPFDLASGPVWRVHVYKRVAGEHLLAMTFHHIAIDFWCGPLLLDELRLRYQAERHGTPLELPPLRAEYSDFVRWQADMVAGPEGQRLLDYWRGRLAGAPPVLDLPTDRPRPRVYTYDGAVCDFHIDQRLTERLKAFARAEGTTLFTVLLAALQVWLHRHTGQEDIVVGSPTAGRVRPGFERIVGYFANPVVLRTDCGGNPAFRALCQQVRGTVLGALEHQAYPFSRLVEVLHPDRDPSRSPLFDVLFTLQSMQRFAREGRLSRLGDRSGMSPFGASSLGSASTRMELGELVFESFPIEMTVAQFDLDIEMIDLHEGLAGKINYNANLFEPPTVARMARRFERLLERFATDPDQPIGDAALLTDDERERIVVQWNATPSDAPIEQCVHALFEAQAARTPDATAIRYAGETLSYAELNGRANRVACSLRASGIEPGRFVAIALEPDWRLPVAMLGVLKAGGAYLPLDCSYPAQRQRFMLDDAAPVLVLTTESLADRLPADGPPRVCIDSILAAAETGAAGNLAPVAGPSELAYVIYTSGSTGTPKGVLVEHRSVVNHNLAVIERFGLEKTDRVLQFASPSFDALVEELFPTWACGGAVVLRESGGAPACEELLRLIDENRITVLNLPTAYWQVWVDEMACGGHRLPASLRAVIVGGDKTSRERFDTWRAIGGDRVRWINTYGPTETTIIVTSFEPTAEWADATSGREIPIGRPLPNTRLYVLDACQQPVPVGVPGELYVGGAPVARGYLHRPELTAERFVPDPFSNEPGARLYRTGDRVRYVDDGLIEFVGRVDAQVKIRGFRVEPGEIEAALLGHAGVREAFVLACEDSGGRTKRLVAYVARVPGASPTPADLRQFLQDSLPAYMVPSVIVPVDALPRLASGKVDRNALPEPQAEVAENVTAAFVAPETPIEETLAGIWRDVLGVERVGVHDNFFELGGDSILSVQVVARANRAGLRLTARHMFQYQTVAELAGVVGTGRPIQAEQGPVSGDVPLTPVQRWFFEQDLAEPHHFNQAVLFELRQRFDPVRLQAAVHHLLIHHDALRLRFTCTEIGWRQRNAGLAESQAEAVFSTIDLSDVPVAVQHQTIEMHAIRLQASLDICEGPFLRVAWFDCGAGSDRLLIVIHHLAVDGVSWRILLEDLFTAYGQ
ncbi:MAG: amino acid adenylation domain-containing protein, partial [Phycisphaerae bacterium]|nr:amino acid adenylation domain-containing protein [Phycisphaerae bacterium]